MGPSHEPEGACIPEKHLLARKTHLECARESNYDCVNALVSVTVAGVP